MIERLKFKSDNQKTPNQEDSSYDFKQFNEMGHSNCSMKTDPFYFTRDLIGSSKTIFFVTT